MKCRSTRRMLSAKAHLVSVPGQEEMSDGFCAAANEEQDGSAHTRANVRILTISHDESIKEDETVLTALSGRPCKQILAWLSVGSSRIHFQ